MSTCFGSNEIFIVELNPFLNSKVIYSVSASSQGATLLNSPLRLLKINSASPNFYFDQFVLRYVRSIAGSVISTGRILRE